MLQSSNQDIKLKIIEQLVSLDDEKLLLEIERLIQISYKQSKLKKFTEEEIIQRAKKSNIDILNNKVFTQKEAENLAKLW